MGKKKSVGAGKSRHFQGRKRIANKTRQMESRIKRLNEKAQEKILSVSPIGRKKEK